MIEQKQQNICQKGCEVQKTPLIINMIMQKIGKGQKKRGNKIIRKSDERNVENAGIKCQRTTCEYNIHKKCEKKIYKKNKDEGTQWDDQQ